jgi:uncharacterized protein
MTDLPAITDLPPELQRLIERAARIELFAIFMTPTEQFQSALTPDGAAMLIAHHHYLFTLQTQNILLAGGPVDFNINSVEGLCIVRAGSRQQAETIAAAEPYGKAGWRTNTVRAWQLNEGALVAAARDVVNSTQTS